MPTAVPPRQPRKKALSIGVEYIELAKTNPECRLQGTHNDTEILADLLQTVYGYQSEDIRILTDAEGGDPSCRPTRANIIAAMHELVKDARPGDRLLFHYSGHGSQVVALVDQNEIDGLDEVIWPADIKYTPATSEDEDFSVENYIVDDDVHRILVKSLPPGVHLVILLDCCSSGTGADLPFTCSASPLSSPVNGRNPFTRPRSQSVLSMPHNAHGVLQKESVSIMALPSNRWSESDQLPYVTSWSACLDDQQTLEDNSGGVFVKAFTEVLREVSYPTHAQLLTALTRWLANHVKSDVWQSSKPQLGSLRDIGSIYDTPFEL